MFAQCPDLAFEIIGRDRVISFSNLDAGDDKRLHFFSDDAIARERNIDALVDFIKKNSPLDPKFEGRIRIN